MSIQDEAVKTAMVRFGLVKEAGIPQFIQPLLAGGSLRSMYGRLGAYHGAQAGGLLGAGVGALSGAVNAEPGDRLRGALKGGLMGGAVGGAAGGIGGRQLGRHGYEQAAALAGNLGGSSVLRNFIRTSRHLQHFLSGTPSTS